LYKEFRLDQPWDSEHNRKLIPRMPAVLRSPFSKAEPGRTTYVVPVGNETVFPGRKGIEFREITDGLSNTIMLVEVDDEHAVIWTRPEDLSIDNKRPTAGLLNISGTGYLAALCDGSVLVISPKSARQNLPAMFTRAGGEVIQP
jgi:hypothetical protein